MADISSLYPQPPQPGAANGLLGGNPLGIAGEALQLSQMQRAIAAKQAVGSAFQSGLNPDGTIDPSRISAGLQAPAAAWSAPEAVGTLLDQRGKMISNNTAQFGLAAGQSGELQNAIGAMAQNPNLQPGDVINTITGIARRTNVPSQVLSSVLAGMPAGGPALRAWAANMANVATGAGAANSRVSGTPNAAGAPTLTTQGAANFAGTYPAVLPPGVGEALASNQAEFANDQSTAASRLANVRPIQQALPMAEQLASTTNFGPGSAEFTKIRAGLANLGLIDPNASEGATRQEIGKYLLKYAQGAQNAGRSDAALATALGSNPNADTMMKPAVISLLKNQIGMDRMDSALPVAFQNQGGDPAQYKTFKSQYYQSQDPKAFWFDLMSPAERQQTLQGLGVTFQNGQAVAPKNPSAAYLKFARSYDTAKSAGVFNPPGAQNAGQ